MKYIFKLLILLVLVTSCDNEFETIHTYSKQYNLSKDYPIFLDVSNILTNIQVKPSVNPEATFKIASTDKYLFIGEMMKGIHVYEKTDAGHADPLCFIECKHLKAFDLTDDHLYCNNFVDLLVIDVKNPAQARILHREENYFNKYSNPDWNMNTINASESGNRLYEIALKTVSLSGIETELDPAPDFSEYDKLYGQIIVDAIPDTIKVDKPYVGFAGTPGMMYTFGYNSLAFCTFDHSGFHQAQSSILFPNNVSSPPSKLHYKDNMLYTSGGSFTTYYDFNLNRQATLYDYSNSKIDVSYMESQKTFWFLSKSGIYGGQTIDGHTFTASINIPGIETLTCIGDHIITLGSRLEVYSVPLLEVVKKYPDISGSCMLKEGDTLIIAGKKGLSFYDISNLKDIKLIP
jgi:hypothetical protein